MQQANSISIRPLIVRRLALRKRTAGAMELIGRQSRLLILTLSLPFLFGTLTGLSAQQATIVVAPPKIQPNTSTDLTVTVVNGTLDLSNFTAKQVAIQPGDDLSQIAVEFPTKRNITISLSVGNAQLGGRTLILFGPDLSSVVASIPLTVVAQGQSTLCPGAENCCRTDRNGLCTECTALACTVPPVCPAGQHCCDDDGGAGGHCNNCLRACP
jgi:hypothetical protein